MRSCLLFAVGVDGAEITTVEGCRSAGGGLGPVQQAFQDCHGLQCGFCTPGFVTTITAYLREHPDPTEEQARQAIGGNLCRCTGYQNIVASVLRAAEIIRAAGGRGDDPDDGGADRPARGPAAGRRGRALPGRPGRRGAGGGVRAQPARGRPGRWTST